RQVASGTCTFRGSPSSTFTASLTEKISLKKISSRGSTLVLITSPKQRMPRTRGRLQRQRVSSLPL
ncbi:hypothetical protein AB1N83_010254, partial [Pleurotus pulmonarius]